MATTYDEQAAMISNQVFVTKCGIVAVNVAIEILADPDRQPSDKTLARSVLMAYENYAERFTAVVAAQAVDKDPQDGDLVQLIRDNWSLVSG